VLIENPVGRGHGVAGALNHLGVEVETPERVQAAAARLSSQGLDPEVQGSTTCCYAVQDKAWVDDGAPWEVYTVVADAPDQSDLGCSTKACQPETVTDTLSGSGHGCC
jgi:hypothetical protein